MAIAIEAAQPSTVTPAVGGAAAAVEPENQSQGVESAARVDQNAFSKIENPLDAAPTQVLGDKREAAAEFNSKLADLGHALDNVARAAEEPLLEELPSGWQPLDPTDTSALDAIADGATVQVSYAGKGTSVAINSASSSLRAMARAISASNTGNAWREATGTSGVGEGPFSSGVIRPGVLPTDQPQNALRVAMEEFAAAYNDVQGAYAAKAKADGAEAKDDTAAGVMSQLAAAVSEAFPQVESTFQSLPEVGIQAGAEGQLQVHTERMEAAIEQSPEDAISLFTSEGGPGGAIRAAISEVYVDPLRGALASGGLEPSIRESEQHIRTSDSELGDLSTKLQERFTEMESAVQEMSQTRAYLQEQLAI